MFDRSLGGSTSGGGGTNLYDSLRGGGTTTHLVENLQAQLKQREGEMVQLQMELGSLERLRDNMSAELGRMTQKVERYENLVEELEEMKKRYLETAKEHQALLTV